MNTSDQAASTGIVQGLRTRGIGGKGQELVKEIEVPGGEDSSKEEDDKNKSSPSQEKNDEQEEEYEEIDVISYLNETYDAWKRSADFSGGNSELLNDNNRARYFIHRERLDSAVNGFLKGVGSDDNDTDAETLKKRIKRLQANLVRNVVGARTDGDIKEEQLKMLDDYVTGDHPMDDFDIFLQNIKEKFGLNEDEADIVKKENLILIDSVKASGAYPINIDEIFYEIGEGVDEDEEIEYNGQAPGETQHLLKKKAAKALLSKFQETFGITLGDEDKKKIAEFINSDMRTTEFTDKLHAFLTDENSPIGKKIPPEKREANSPEMAEFSALKDKLTAEQYEFENKDREAKRAGKESEIEGVERCPAKEKLAEFALTPQNYLTAANSALVFLLPPPLNIVGMYLAAYLTLKVLPMEGEKPIITKKTSKKITFDSEQANILKQRAKRHKIQESKETDVPGMPNATKQTDPEPPVEEEKKKIVQENVPKPLNTVKEEKTIEQQPVPRPLNAIKEEKTIEQQPVPRPLNAIKERKERGGMTL